MNVMQRLDRSVH